ncbi:hypothetical protein [Streptomyces johnsoniae]|uniref:Integral membrane protein n=1 Tax=Streptomyces johnsoniae TaxID=3075532 RepID=A0ABU2S3X6_9ACTN|nr:hypothetical protein [Streptomyces sp. DSM 41886]MDT0443667.1 hypothetical protein [Streptomyces sp. DSM 41886]
MTDRRRAAGQQDRKGEEDNPFAPPPEGQPDRPWQPRRPEGSDGDGEDGTREGPQRQRWGSQWSRRQPKRQNGGFGEPPSETDRKPGGPGGGSRWDPSDPAQRHARYAVLAGMWGVFGGLLGWEWLALLLGALALYWGISALRGGPKEKPEGRNRRLEKLEGEPPPPSGPPSPGPAAPGARPARPQFAAAVSGVVLASAALAIVAATYTVQLVYKDYFDCVSDALTRPSQQACEELLPSQLRPILGEQD